MAVKHGNDGWMASCPVCGYVIAARVDMMDSTVLDRTMQRHMEVQHDWPVTQRPIELCKLCKEPIKPHEKGYAYHLTGPCHVNCYDLAKADEQEDKQPITLKEIPTELIPSGLSRMKRPPK